MLLTATILKFIFIYGPFAVPGCVVDKLVKESYIGYRLAVDLQYFYVF